MIPYSWHCALPLKEEHTLAILLLPPTTEFMHWSFALMFSGKKGDCRRKLQ